MLHYSAISLPPGRRKYKSDRTIRQLRQWVASSQISPRVTLSTLHHWSSPSVCSPEFSFLILYRVLLTDVDNIIRSVEPSYSYKCYPVPDLLELTQTVGWTHLNVLCITSNKLVISDQGRLCLVLIREPNFLTTQSRRWRVKFPYFFLESFLSNFVACLIETHWICGSFLQLDIKGCFLWRNRWDCNELLGKDKSLVLTV